MTTKMTNEEGIKILNEVTIELINLCKKDVMTKDGYGLLMGFVSSQIPHDSQKNFILLCVKNGYPLETGKQIIEILGLG